MTVQYCRDVIHIVTVISELLTEYLRGLVVVQQNNQKHLSFEDQIKERQGGLLKLGLGETSEDLARIKKIKEANSDEPLIYPVIEKEKLQLIYSGL